MTAGEAGQNERNECFEITLDGPKHRSCNGAVRVASLQDLKDTTHESMLNSTMSIAGASFKKGGPLYKAKDRLPENNSIAMIQWSKVEFLCRETDPHVIIQVDRVPPFAR